MPARGRAGAGSVDLTDVGQLGSPPRAVHAFRFGSGTPRMDDFAPSGMQRSAPDLTPKLLRWLRSVKMRPRPVTSGCRQADAVIV
jgi:hypothetical protein